MNSEVLYQEKLISFDRWGPTNWNLVHSLYGFSGKDYRKAKKACREKSFEERYGAFQYLDEYEILLRTCEEFSEEELKLALEQIGLLTFSEEEKDGDLAAFNNQVLDKADKKVIEEQKTGDTKTLNEHEELLPHVSLHSLESSEPLADEQLLTMKPVEVVQKAGRFCSPFFKMVNNIRKQWSQLWKRK